MTPKTMRASFYEGPGRFATGPVPVPPLASGEQPTVAGDHIVAAIDQDRDVEAESLEAIGDLPDLLFAVAPRIGRIRLKVIDQPVDHCQWPGFTGFRLVAVVVCWFHGLAPRCTNDFSHRGITKPSKPFEFRKPTKF